MKSIRGSYGGSSLDFDRVLALMAKDAFKILLRPDD